MGPKLIHFTLPRKLLYFHSKFAERALKGHFREATKQVLQFPQDDPEVFHWLVQWFYQGKLGIADHLERQHRWRNIPKDWREDSCRLLCRLSILAEKLLDENPCWSKWPENSIHDDILDELKELFRGASDGEKHTPVLPDLVIEVWENTVPDFEEFDWSSYVFPHHRPSLRQIIFHELCSSYFHKVNVLNCEEYSECLLLDDGKFGADVLSDVMSKSNSPWRY